MNLLSKRSFSAPPGWASPPCPAPATPKAPQLAGLSRFGTSKSPELRISGLSDFRSSLGPVGDRQLAHRSSKQTWASRRSPTLDHLTLGRFGPMANSAAPATGMGCRSAESVIINWRRESVFSGRVGDRQLNECCDSLPPTGEASEWRPNPAQLVIANWPSQSASRRQAHREELPTKGGLL